MVISAQKRASSTATGSCLGLEQSAVLEWHGQEKLNWIQFLPFLRNLGTNHCIPDVLIIHLEDKHLLNALDLELMGRVKREWFLLRTLYPKVRMIWSEIIPQDIRHAKQNHRKRTVVNREMSLCVKSYGGSVIGHPEISFEDPKLFLEEADLSQAGLDIFLEDIRNGILSHVLHSSKATGAGLKDPSLPPAASPAASTGLASEGQEPVTQDDKVVSSSEEASSAQTSTGQAAVSSQSVKIKEENSGEASPSPQAETSGTGKKKKKGVGKEPASGKLSLISSE